MATTDDWAPPAATENLAQWIARVQYSDLPSRVIEETKRQILCVLGAVYASYHTDAGRAVLAATAKWGAGDGPCTVLPTGRKTSLHNAVYANASLSMTLDYDDYLFAGHTGHSAVLTPLALAESDGLTGEDILLLTALANEVEGRVGASVLIGPLNGQLWTFIHLVGGAAIRARQLSLSPDKIRDALGIALTQPPWGLMAGFMGSEGKTIIAGQTTADGIRAAELAAEGLTGTPDILENKQGFVRRYANTPIWGVYSGLGTTWLTDTLCYKIYPGCAYIDSFVDCLLALKHEHDIDAGAIDKVLIKASILTTGMDALSKPSLRREDSTPTTLNFSVPYNAAVALIDGEVTPKQFTRERIRDKSVWELADKVELKNDNGLTMRLNQSSVIHLAQQAAKRRGDSKGRFDIDLSEVDLSEFEMAFGADCTVTLKDGTELNHREEIPRGCAGRPKDENQRLVEEKFRREASAVIDDSQQIDEALAMINRIEKLDADEVRKLAGLLSP